MVQHFVLEDDSDRVFRVPPSHLIESDADGAMLYDCVVGMRWHCSKLWWVVLVCGSESGLTDCQHAVLFVSDKVCQGEFDVSN